MCSPFGYFFLMYSSMSSSDLSPHRQGMVQPSPRCFGNILVLRLLTTLSQNPSTTVRTSSKGSLYRSVQVLSDSRRYRSSLFGFLKNSFLLNLSFRTFATIPFQSQARSSSILILSSGSPNISLLFLSYRFSKGFPRTPFKTILVLFFGHYGISFV